MMGKGAFGVAILVVSVAAAPACATKKFVRTSVGDVDSKVDSLGGTVEETQGRVARNGERIGQVDQKAEAAGKSAADARAAAESAATAAGAVGSRVDAVERDVAATRRLVYEVTLSEDQSNFKFGSSELPPDAQARLDEVVAHLKTEPVGVYIEIEGHTDSTGDAALNNRLGLARAEQVKRYLYERHQVPLHKMNVISFGEEKPVAPNNTREGRAQNRRVVIRVLS